MIIRNLFLISCFSVILTTARSQGQSAFTANWPEWRGPYNSGSASGGNTPVEFSETKNIKWKLENFRQRPCHPNHLG